MSEKKLSIVQRERLGLRQYDTSNFNYDALTAPPIASLLSPWDMKQIHDICLDPRLNNKLREKESYYESILNNRGFQRLGRGTNRVVFKYLENQNIVLKVPLSEAGRNDNPMEMKNQWFIKPFCTKVFDVSQDGLIGLFERGELIRSDEIFYEFAPQIFRILNMFLGKYIMADVGSEFRKNWLIRPGFGPMLGDFPTIYPLDGNKLYCNAKEPFTDIPCGGHIDYDAGFNRLYCKKCGKQYFASQLARKLEDGTIIKRRGANSMKIIVNLTGEKENEKVVDSVLSSKTYLRETRSKKQQAEETTSYLEEGEKMRPIVNLHGYSHRCGEPDPNNKDDRDYVQKEIKAIEQEQKELTEMYEAVIAAQKTFETIYTKYEARRVALEQRSQALADFVNGKPSNETPVQQQEFTEPVQNLTPPVNQEEESIPEPEQVEEENNESSDLNEAIESDEQTNDYLQYQINRLIELYQFTKDDVIGVLDSTGFDIEEAENILKQRRTQLDKKANQEAKNNSKSNSYVEELTENSNSKYPAKGNKNKGNKHLSGMQGF